MISLNPITRKIYSSDGSYLKTIGCPLRKKWDDLDGNISNQSLRTCAACEQAVVDTEKLTANELELMLVSNPDQCIKININQSNIRIDHND